jgi:DNA-binding transcriptional MerR regulator
MDSSANEIFFLAHVAAIIQIPESLVKNWTIGRPLKIGTHRSAMGTGSRNLYNIHDLYRFAVAKRLSIDGFAPRAIQSILDGLSADFTSSEFAIVTCGAGHHLQRSKQINLQVQLISQLQLDREWWRIIDAVRSSFGCHILHIAGITENVDHRAEEFIRRSFGHQPPPTVSEPSQLEASEIGRVGRVYRRVEDAPTNTKEAVESGKLTRKFRKAK